MAILILFFGIFGLAPLGWTETVPQGIEVIFDGGNPEASVAVIGGEIFESGSLYENYQISSFSEEGVIVTERTTQDSIKWFKDGGASETVIRKARLLFVAKQMRAIHEAQLQYINKFLDHYAPNLDVLLEEGFLPDGFKEGVKMNYLFYIQNTGQERQWAIQSEKTKTYLAIAEPLEPEESVYYFSVDHLGQVRYAESLAQVTWGPVWDYLDPTAAKTPARNLDLGGDDEI